MTSILGTGSFRYEVAGDWGRLPDGWAFGDVAAVAVDRQDRVYVFNRGEHPMIVFDRQGVVDEQAIGYQLYNYERYTVAREVLLACGLKAPRRFELVRKIPGFLGHATQPDGRYPLIGDTLDVEATVIPGTRSPAEVAQNVEIFAPQILSDFWAELKHEGLLRADAPTP